MANFEDTVTPGVSTAMAARRLKAEIKNIEQDTNLKGSAETVNSVEQQRKARELTVLDKEIELLDRALAEAKPIEELYKKFPWLKQFGELSQLLTGAGNSARSIRIPFRR